MIDNTLVQGAQNIFFAELASHNTARFSVEATRFMSGKFPFMIFGLPAAALAMYRAAKPHKRKIVGGLLVSAALTSMLTGITEPIEFTFLFVAPVMYAVHCVLAGLSYMLTHIFGVGVGMTFSGGLIDLTLFGILQGNAKTNWIWIVVIGLVYAVIYYFVFSFMINRFDLKTPGREADDESSRLYTRKDMEKKKKAAEAASENVSALILKGLGGKDNISDLDCCATRLRVTVYDESIVSESLLQQSGASGVIKKGKGVQVIYGPQVSVVKSKLEDYMEHGFTENDEPTSIPLKNEGTKSPETLSSHMNGNIVPLENVSDEVFRDRILGDGVAIEPREGKLFSPCDGKVESVFETKHAVNIVSDNGCEVLLHIGIDTVKLNGKYFAAKVEDGQSVKKGDLLISFDMEGIKKAGFKLTTPMIVCNSDDYTNISVEKAGRTTAGNDIIKLS